MTVLPWLAEPLSRERPIYLSLADRIEEAVGSGVLRPGTRLPPQRSLAESLGIDFSTVSRAYAEARRRGLVSGQVGRGTFIRSAAVGEPRGAAAAAGAIVDLSVNLPPAEVVELAGRALPEALTRIAGDPSAPSLLRYQPNAGRAEHRETAAGWISAHLGEEIDPRRVVLCGGGQHALASILASIVPGGAVVATEELTYPGFKSLAELLHVRLEGVETDRDGLASGALSGACRASEVRALYCTPTLQNPTTAVMPRARREEVAGIAVERGLVVIEDDVYGPLVADPPPSLALMCGAGGYYVASLSKILAPGLRLAIVVAPGTREAEKVAWGVRATGWMASPLAVEVAVRWMKDGTANRLVSASRSEAAARQRIAAEAFSGAGLTLRTRAESLHAWMELPAPWTTAEYVFHARALGVAVAPAEMFAVQASHAPAGVRLSLCAAPTHDVLSRALERLIGLSLREPSVGLAGP